MAELDKKVELTPYDLGNVAGGADITIELTEEEKAKILAAVQMAASFGLDWEAIVQKALDLLASKPEATAAILEYLEQIKPMIHLK